jgi:CBS domain-containing protein
MADEISGVNRAERFIHLFNRIQSALLQLTGQSAATPFKEIVKKACTLSAAVRANRTRLEQSARLRNAIIHDEEYPPHIVAIPSEGALQRFEAAAQQILEPIRVMPTFSCKVHCFSVTDSLLAALSTMEENDFTQVACRENDGRLRLVTAEGVTNWLRRRREHYPAILDKTTLTDVLADEPAGCFTILAPDKTVFDAKEAFLSIPRGATRIYAIIVTDDGTDKGQAVGFITPWDLLHNPRLRTNEHQDWLG